MDDSRQLHYYRLEPEEVMKELETNPKGLTQGEAKARLTKHGHNTLAVKHKDPLPIVYLRQFRDLMIILLVASSICPG